MIRDCLAAIGALTVLGSLALGLVAGLLAYRAAQLRRRFGTQDEHQGAG